MDRRKLMLVAATIVAVLGTALVFVYVQGADSRAAAKLTTVELLRAVAVIEPGETIDDAAANGKLQLGPVPQIAALENAVTSTEALTGEAANTRIYPGEQIVTDKFGDAGDASVLPIPEGNMAISVELTDTSRVAGFIKAGSRVAVFINGVNPDGSQFTRLLLPDVTVVAVGSSTPTTASDEEVVAEQVPATILTMALDQVQAQKVLYATKNGELAFALRNSDSAVVRDDGVTAANLFE